MNDKSEIYMSCVFCHIDDVSQQVKYYKIDIVHGCSVSCKHNVPVRSKVIESSGLKGVGVHGLIYLDTKTRNTSIFTKIL